jgi:outer membrane protein TolC
MRAVIGFQGRGLRAPDGSPPAFLGGRLMTSKAKVTAAVRGPRYLATRLPLLALLCAALGQSSAWGDDAHQAITFSKALALVSGQNPQIAFANQRICEGFAELRAAEVLWLPSIQAGINYQNHDGPLQNSDGSITSASRSALEAGLGMYAVGGGAPAIPGLSAKFAVADAVFQPQIAGQRVAARQHAATATTHDLLLMTAVAYLDLLRAFQQQAIAQETCEHAEQLAKRTAEFVRTGQGNQADADRAQTELALRRNAVAQATVQTRVASARLVELLDLPSERVLVPEEPALVPIELVSDRAATAELVADGLSHRPELAESRHLLAEAQGRLDRERYAPLLPNLLLDVSQGGFGGGMDSSVADFRGRFDFDATVYWQLRNFGLGEGAARDAARARLEQARLLEIRLTDRVAREVTEAHAQSQSLRGQIGVAEAGIRVAGESYRRNLARIRGGQGLPLEVLQSLQALDQSRREYLRAVGDYDEWQFRLYRALGCPIPPDPPRTR